MALSVAELLDIYKREATNISLSNINYKYYILKNRINTYIKYGGLFQPLANIYQPSISKISSSVINAYISLIFLDFFGLYQICKYLDSKIDNLSIVSTGKMRFSEYLFQDIFSSIKSSHIKKNAIYGFYEDFTSKKFIDEENTKKLLYIANAINPLSAENGILTLPYLEKKILRPTLSTFGIKNDVDGFYEKATDGISVYQKASYKTGFVYSVIADTGNTNNGTGFYLPSASGILNTLICEDISISITSINVLDIENTITSINIVCGCMGIFSNEVQLVQNGTIFSGNIKIWDTEDIEIKISFDNPSIERISVNDKWTLKIKYIENEDINIESKYDFNIMSQISHIQIKSISPFDDYIESAYKISERLTQQEKIENYSSKHFYTNIPINSSLNRLILNSRVPHSEQMAIDLSLYNKYTVDRKINAVYGEFIKTGVIAFKEIQIDKNYQISRISVNANIYEKSDNDNVEILFGVLLKSNKKEEVIYIPTREAQTEISLNQIESLKLISAGEYYSSTKTDTVKAYIKKYGIKLDTFENGYKYTKTNNKFYLEFSDERILENRASENAFIKSVIPFISIKSMENIHYSPLIYNYSIELS